MKKLIASIVVLFVITCYLMSCEKDDLCAEDTPTTPGLVINFYQENNTTQPQTFDALVYSEVGSTKTDTVFNESQLILPLKSDTDNVAMNLEIITRISETEFISETATLAIDYTRTQTYVSRACGYKTTFSLLPNTQELPNPRVTPVAPSITPWFRQDNIEVINTNIEIQDAEEPHINIYF